jgi:hypothetical protein
MLHASDFGLRTSKSKDGTSFCCYTCTFMIHSADTCTVAWDTQMTRLFFTVLLVGLASSASAFILPASALAQQLCSSCWNKNDIVDSTVLLFANAKKKGAKKKNSMGGEGFGSARTSSAEKNKPKPSQQDGPQGLVGGVAVAAKKARQARRQKWSQDDDDGSDDEATLAETARLTAIYTEQFQQQQEQLLKTVPPRRLVQQISQSPLLFLIDDFLDPAACARVQSNGAGCFDLMFPEQLSDLLFQGQESEMDGLLFNQASSRDHSESSGDFPDGLHMDTNGQCTDRHVTAILYLNDVPVECGGATVFPLARTLPADPALAASRRLLAEGISHTRSPSCVDGLQADAQLLESRGVGSNYGANPDTETAIRIQPKAGRLLVFFSRDSNGEEDPGAWHAGERLYDRSSESSESPVVTEKRILTLFKQVDYADTDCDDQPSRVESEGTFEAFLSPQIREQQKWLQAKAQSQSQF